VPSVSRIAQFEGDASGAKTCFHPEAAKGNDEYLLNVARRRRRGEWVV
jgi:hypothetical protein